MPYVKIDLVIQALREYRAKDKHIFKYKLKSKSSRKLRRSAIKELFLPTKYIQSHNNDRESEQESTSYFS